VRRFTRTGSPLASSNGERCRAAPSSESATGSAPRIVTPTLAQALTPGEASAFMTTTRQWPLRIFHVAVRVPDVAQNVCAVGRAGTTEPPVDK
jgi:hypothetical protein